MAKIVKTLFFGSGEFAVPILERLVNSGIVDLMAVVTQPDRPAGRKQELQAVPVKTFLTDNDFNLKTYQPESYRKLEGQILAEQKPELIIVADYGQILPETTINFPKYKCLNIHGSLLPDLRGAVPIPVAILQGYQTTGVSIPVMTVGLDDGPVIAARELTISPRDTTASLKSKLAKSGADLLVEILPDWLDGKIEPQEQNHELATIADKNEISKDKAKFNKDTSVQTADKMIRAFYPWPIAWCELERNGMVQRLKVYKGEPKMGFEQGEVGQIVREGKNLLMVLSNGVLTLEQIQLEGKGIGRSEDYLYLDGSVLL